MWWGAVCYSILWPRVCWCLEWKIWPRGIPRGTAQSYQTDPGKEIERTCSACNWRRQIPLLLICDIIFTRTDSGSDTIDIPDDRLVAETTRFHRWSSSELTAEPPDQAGSDQGCDTERDQSTVHHSWETLHGGPEQVRSPNIHGMRRWDPLLEWVVSQFQACISGLTRDDQRKIRWLDKSYWANSDSYTSCSATNLWYFWCWVSRQYRHSNWPIKTELVAIYYTRSRKDRSTATPASLTKLQKSQVNSHFCHPETHNRPTRTTSQSKLHQSKFIPRWKNRWTKSLYPEGVYREQNQGAMLHHRFQYGHR